jgi:two-component system sensor histidine kinase/response regulator
MNKKYENKILLVDDDTKNLQVAMNILKDYNVIYAQSGEKALELLEKNKFDLILLDIVMPTMNGFDVCYKIKNDDKTKKIPVIFLTVKDDEKDIVKGFEVGAVDYVTKPFYSEVLLKRVELHLKLASTIDEIEQINSNLNERVKEQIREIREKDEIIIQNSKISAISSVIDILALQWKKPLDKIKFYLQSLDFEAENKKELKSNDIFNKTLNEVDKLDEIMYDFHKFFSNQSDKEEVNIKVSFDNAIFSLKDEIKDLNIDINVEGDNLLSLNVVVDEIKHIFSKLLNKSIENFKANSDTI